MVLALAGDSTITSDLPMDRKVPEFEEEKIRTGLSGTAIYSGHRA
jgi:hypothetical protein